MEIINELVSYNIGYINALRNAEPLPKNISTSLTFSRFLKYTLIVSGVSLLLYTIVVKSEEEK